VQAASAGLKQVNTERSRSAHCKSRRRRKQFRRRCYL